MYAGKQAAFDAGVKQKALTDVEIEKLMSWLEEAALMNDALKPIYEEAVRRGYEDAASRVGVTDEGSVVQSTLVRQSVETLLGRWEETTQKFVLDIIQQGVDEGLTVTEIQKSLIESRAYDPVRALRVARTETTRTLNAAASAAYNQAALNGTPLKRKWISARDDHVRDSHRVLDGTIINPGERYFSINGGSAEFPGGFGSGSEDINCRCVEQEIFE
jgi:SPP1 gp7 family putative phage head morphogenesis protein